MTGRSFYIISLPPPPPPHPEKRLGAWQGLIILTYETCPCMEGGGVNTKHSRAFQGKTTKWSLTIQSNSSFVSFSLTSVFWFFLKPICWLFYGVLLTNDGCCPFIANDHYRPYSWCYGLLGRRRCLKHFAPRWSCLVYPSATEWRISVILFILFSSKEVLGCRECR